MAAKVKFREELFVNVVLVVKSRDEFGRPKQVEVLYEGEKVTIPRGSNFSAFVPEKALQPPNRGDC